MAKNIYWAYVLTGGGDGALDKIDGSILNDLDAAIVVTLAARYVYSLDDDSGAAESSPEVISPDDNAGTKRWILTGISQIGVTPISAAQWGYVGDMNLGVVIDSVPAFRAIPSVNQTNFAVGAAVTVVFGTVRFDIGGNFAANKFTAPVTGKYLLNVSLWLLTVDSGATIYEIRLVTDNKTYKTVQSTDQFAGDLAHWTINLDVIADMDAGHTAHVEIYQTGGLQQTDISTASHFGGVLVA